MHAWFAEAIAEGDRERRVRRSPSPSAPTDRLLALIDGYGVRALTEDPAMPLERAREEIWAAIAPELGVQAERVIAASASRSAPSARGRGDLERRRGLDRDAAAGRSTVSRVRKLARPTASSVHATTGSSSRPSGRR